MDWTTPLKSQQADFIKRLRSDATNLLHCQTRGCHSELTAISGETLKKIRAFCRKLALSADQSDSVRDILRQHLQVQLGEEAIAIYLDGLATKLDVQARDRANNTPNLTLTSDSNIGIQVKTAYGSVDSIRWPIRVEEVKHNAVVVCILLQEEVNETQEAYNLILSGFVPTNTIEMSDSQVNLGIADLLYSGGLRSYLESLKSDPSSWEWLRILTGSSTYVYPVAISADGQTFACSGYDGSIKLWKLSNKQLSEALSGHSWSFYPLSSGGGGQPLASGSSDKKINLLHSGTGELLRSLAGHTSGVSSVAISPNGQFLISGGYDGTIKIWHLTTGEMLRRMAGHSGMVRPIAISPDGKIIASASIDKTLKLWYVSTGEPIRTLSVQTDPVVSITISPDGQTLASGTQDGTIDIWHLATGELQNTLTGHSGTVRSITISEDGQTLASGSTEKTIKLWDLQTGKLRRTITGHSDPLINLAPNPNGHTLDLSLYRHRHPGWTEPSQL